MQFRHDRRRRVLTDELSSSVELSLAEQATAGTPAASGTGVRYGEAARRERQPRLTDLVPSRYLTLSLLLGANLLWVALLLVGYRWQSQLANWVGAETATSLDLAQRGSLATWFNSLLLFSTAGVALLIYSLRRHRVDDYHGRYRVWLSALIACLVLSIDETTAIHRCVYMGVTPLANWMGTTPIALGRGVLSALLGGFAVRVLVETWRCRAASAALSLAAGLLTASVAIHVGWIAVESDTQRAMLSAGLQMLGHVSLLAALMLYARYVILDVEGLLPVRVKKVKKVKAVKKPAKKVNADDTELPVDPPQKISKPHVPVKTDLDPVAPPAARGLFSGKAQPAVAKAAAPAATKPAVTVDRDEDEDDDEAASGRGLSRAERKKLRRQMRRQGADSD